MYVFDELPGEEQKGGDEAEDMVVGGVEFGGEDEVLVNGVDDVEFDSGMEMKGVGVDDMGLNGGIEATLVGVDESDIDPGKKNDDVVTEVVDDVTEEGIDEVVPHESVLFIAIVTNGNPGSKREFQFGRVCVVTGGGLAIDEQVEMNWLEESLLGGPTQTKVL